MNKLRNAANSYAFDLDEGDLNTSRDTFVAGAQWMKEQLINKACEWLVEHSNDYLINDKYPLPCGEMSRDWLKVKSEMFDDFRKAMEEQQ